MNNQIQKQPERNQLTPRQKQALLALWTFETPLLNAGQTVFARRMKQLLLRAFVIHKRRDQLSPDTLYKHHCDIKRRLKQCLALQQDFKRGWGLKRCYPEIPYYLFVFLEETKGSPTPVECKQTLEVKKVFQKVQRVGFEKRHKVFLFYYYTAWTALVRWFIDTSAKNSKVVCFKKTLGSISLVPIKIANEPLKVRGVCINYHDLYHLEVAQLQRIQMGKNWVSGIDGINITVFHDSPIVEEYEGFLDEARIAIHEGLTRPTAFSQLKALCWMILLILKGINPLAVLIRHIKSMNKKQQELWCL
ncbi:hypothetical protein [Brasilonema octagenarum]|uniref:Uncharacterized protein n=1 Tax=Brasilonema octagenarum UFV-OR1 TaxID=417115 RepID=A0ABX1MC33_9CYAN|nr:hypothetical protein [Brasilonema octagenarum]NMF65350.1 hypothetical protein [Brasilonema octagenarum UFV-OR1]